MSRTLPILNAVGCLLLAGLALFQWGRERDLESNLHQARIALRDERAAHDGEKRRSAALERDIGLLKESIAALQLANEALGEVAAAKEAELDETKAVGEALTAKLAEWEAAVAARDAKLEEMDAALTETRKRLDEAIGRLKQAGAR